MQMKLLQIVEPFHRSWSKRDSFPGLHPDNRRLRKKDILQYRWYLGEMSTNSLPLEKRYELRIMTA